jgi:hypothetical protein
MTEMNYATYDYDSAKTELTRRLTAKSAWKDRVQSATGQIIVDLVAYLMDQDGYKIEREAQERMRRFARRRSSVVEGAENTGYTARRKTSSVCTLRFTSATVPVVIPAGVVCTSTGGVQFVTTAGGTITGLYVDLAAKQGVPKTLAFVSDGLPGQALTVPESGTGADAVEDDSLVVEVNGVEWTEVDTLFNQLSTAQVYTVTRKGTFLLIEFGDGSNGAIPSVDLDIDVSWLESLGVLGNVAALAAVNSIVTTGYTGVTVENTDAAQGGEDEEETEEIRENWPAIFATGDRAVVASDYRAILQAYAGVAKAEVYGEQELLDGADSNPDYAWEIKLVVVPTGGGTLTRTQEFALSSYLEDYKQVLGTAIEFVDPTYVEVDFKVKAKIAQNVSLATAQDNIEEALDDLLNFSDSDLGEALRFSDVTAAIDGAEGVSSHITDVYATKSAGTGGVAKTVFASTDTGIGNIDLLPIDLSNVSIYLETVATGVRRRVGYDDGSGALESSALAASPKVLAGAGSVIDYELGTFSITFDAIVTAAYEVVIEYQTGAEATAVIGVGDDAEVTFTGVLERNLSPGFVEIYEEGTLVATDDGAGSLVDAGGGRVTSGTVAYTMGDVQVLFTSAPADETEVSVNYYYENQDLEPELEQMLLMGKKTVSVVSVQ